MDDEKRWAVDRVIERAYERMFGDFDELVSDGTHTDEEILEVVRFGWSPDIAECYNEWILEGAD